jgi:MYXO-CTERM domain-containing protein
MDQSVRKSYYAGGISMVRKISACMLVAGACVILQGIPAFGGISNGTFQGYDSVPRWDPWKFSASSIAGGNLVPAGDTGVLMNQAIGGITYIYQNFTADSGNYLQFDLKFEFGAFTLETGHFTACLMDPGTIPVLDDNFIPSNAQQFYSINTRITDREHSSSDVQVQMIGGDYNFDDDTDLYYSIRRIRIPLVTGSYSKIWFGLSEFEFDDTYTAATLDNVDDIELSTVPEPTAMTLGLIGLGAVGAIRRRMR